MPPHRFAVSVAYRASRRRGPQRESLMLVESGMFSAVHLDRHRTGAGNSHSTLTLRATRAAVITPYRRQQRDPAGAAERTCNVLLIPTLPRGTKKRWHGGQTLGQRARRAVSAASPAPSPSVHYSFIQEHRQTSLAQCRDGHDDGAILRDE